MLESEERLVGQPERVGKGRLRQWWDRKRQGISALWQRAKPGPGSWKGAGWGMLAALGLILLASIFDYVRVPRPNPGLLLVVALVGGGSALAGWGISALIRGLSRLPRFFSWAMFTGLVMLAFTLMGVPPRGAAVVALVVLGVGALVGGGLGGLLRDRGTASYRPRRLLYAAGLVAGLVALGWGLYTVIRPGWEDRPMTNAAAQAGVPVQPLDLPDPSRPGDVPVLTLSYGSGLDRHRPEFGPDAGLITSPVDGSALLEGWDGLTGSLRTAYWGFDSESLPLNARVWYPDGAGPFPLVLIVHGNHSMEDYSDPGYAYLGELLASRGFITASVDENFLNGGATDALGIPDGGLEEENDARGWLLLEHLKQWRGWNADPDSPFYRKVDLERIGLIGHSRGGEAVAVAAAFNRLPYYPDDAGVAFDYGFGIRAVAAIAPIDGQYRPGEQGTPLENVHYFIIHGSHDGDVRSMVGLRQYDRLAFRGEEFWFKSGLYVGRANHGQFNSGWGRTDSPGLVRWLMNLRPILPAAQQEHIARVYLSAFLEAALHDQMGYLPLFRDARAGAGWLPDTVYLNQYLDSTFRPLATFEEDLNLTTATLPGGILSGDNLSAWREQRVGLKWGARETAAVYLGWDREKHPETAVYRLRLPQSGLEISPEATLVFSMAEAHPDSDQEAQAGEPAELTDLTVELVDRDGDRASLPLSSYSYLQPQIPAQIMKAGFLSETAVSEAIYQLFEFPLAGFHTASPNFDPARLAEIRFLFDRTEKGEVILDQLGFRTPSE